MKAWLAQQAKAILESKYFRETLINTIVLATGSTSGFLGWIYKWVAAKLVDFVLKHGHRVAVGVETKEEVKVQLETYKEVLKNPESTADDIKKASTAMWTS